MDRRVIHLVVDLREEKTVKALTAQVSVLEAQIADLTARIHKAEYDLMFEYRVNEQIVDLCREHGVVIPRRLFRHSENPNGLVGRGK